MRFNMPFLGSPYFKRNSFNNSYSNGISNMFHNNKSRPSRMNFPEVSESYPLFPTNDTNNYNKEIKKEPTPSTRNSTRSETIPTDFFEIFGIKLYYDDILLISLIFFLYSEGVEDNELFITLILLLLS